MIFTDLRFLLCLILCWITFFAVPARYRTAALAFWGVVFYAIYAARFLPLVIVLTAITYAASRRSWRWMAGITIAGALAWFKWQAGDQPVLGNASLLMPLGLSFLAFEFLHVLIERSRGRLGAVGPVDLLAYAFFFPARAAGPIKRYQPFLDSVTAAEASFENLSAGALRVLLGLTKKLVVADLLALTVAQHRHVDSATQAWIVVFAYSVQILLDFSAYSDLAIGFARMLGIRLPENFNWPYTAPNIREFWNRWHITLSEWVRDYVFMPTGRVLFKTRLRQSPTAIAAFAFLLTFLVVGAWHGLTVPFILWGLYHGLLLSAHHVIKTRTPLAVARHPLYQSKAAVILSTAVTFLFVTIGWVPFMTDLEGVRRLATLMFGGSI